MLAAATAGLALSSGFSGFSASRSAVQVRSTDAAMMSRFNGEVWSFEAKKALFDEWDPEKPRDYDNFNPFERNDEGQVADTNGCFPGQSRGYKVPTRPDVNWAIQQEQNKKMEELKLLPKFNIKGKPGNYNTKWQENLGAPP